MDLSIGPKILSGYWEGIAQQQAKPLLKWTHAIKYWCDFGWHIIWLSMCFSVPTYVYNFGKFEGGPAQ